MGKIITGWTLGIKCKNGTIGMVINYVEENHVSNDKDFGHLCGTQFMDFDEFSDGTITVKGKLTVGAPIRIMKEEVNGMDRVTFVEIGDKKYNLFTPLVPEKENKEKK